MRILEINNNFKPFGGVESVYHNTINLLEERGHSVIPFSVSDDNNIKTVYEKYFVDKNKITHNSFYSFESVKKLTQLLEIEKPDIAHIHTFIGGVTPSVLTTLKRKNIPIVLSIHGFKLLCPAHVFINGKGEVCDMCKTEKYYQCVFNRCDPKGISKSILITAESYIRNLLFPFRSYVDQYIFVSKFIENKYCKFYPDLEMKSNHIYNFTYRLEEKNKKGDYFLYFGRLSREKGLLTLLSAFKMLPQLQLKIVGNGILKNTINEIKSPNVELLSSKYREELELLIYNSLFVVVPSECEEALSMSTVESFSMSKPVIGTNIGALAELISLGERGYIFDPKDVQRLAQILSEASNISERLYLQMSQNVYDYAKENFLPEKHYNQLIEVFERALKS